MRPDFTPRRLVPLVIVLGLASGFLAPSAATAATSAPAATADGPSWSVGPVNGSDGAVRPNFNYSVDPGTVITDSITVRNDGGADLTVDIYPADAFTTREGNIDVLTTGSESVDAGTWVSLTATSLTLVPGQETVVPFTVTIPADASPGDHPAGIVTSLRTEDSTAQVQLDRRLGSRMQIRVSGELVPAAEVSKPVITFSGGWNPLAEGFVTVDYSLTNAGNTRITALANVTLSGPFGLAEVTTAERQLNEILPGSTIDVTEEVDGVAALFWLAGSVVVAPSSVGFGAATMDVVLADVSVAAVPYAALLILLVVAAAIVAAVLIVRRRGTRAGRDARSAGAPPAH